jgi:hypothetical protein
LYIDLGSFPKISHEYANIPKSENSENQTVVVPFWIRVFNLYSSGNGFDPLGDKAFLI